MTGANEFWHHPRFDGLGLFRARFTAHRYDLHTHPTYVVALITEGGEQVRVGKRSVLAPAGSVFVVNPEEWHDGEAAGEDGWAYRTFYPPVDLVDRLAGELGQDPAPLFPRALLDDPALARLLAAAHRLSRAAEPAAAEAAMLAAFARLILRHADRKARPARLEDSGSRRRFALYRQIVEDELTETLDLQRLAGAAGVTRFQVIRDFKAAAGPTPATFIRDRRLRRAAGLIGQGAGLAEAASAAGFADQSHLTRAYRAAYGMTPGAFRKAFSAPRRRRG